MRWTSISRVPAPGPSVRLAPPAARCEVPTDREGDEGFEGGMDIQVSAQHILSWPGGSFRCALGRGGIRADKREGDGATPVGCFTLRRVLYRPDRLVEVPRTGLPVAPIAPKDGWCDDAGDPAYNRPVTLPYAA